MLANIRKPYLNVDSRNAPLGRQSSRTLDLKDTDPLWAGIRHLTNEERDQIDMQARVILTRCADRVKEMEALEKRAVLSPPTKSDIRPIISFSPLSRTHRARCK